MQWQASAGPYANNLHLAPDRSVLTTPTPILQAGFSL